MKATGGWYNGNFWVSLGDIGRLYYTAGFGEGVGSIYKDLYSQIEFQKTKDLMEKTFNEKYNDGRTTCGAIVDFLDKFYSTFQYRIIPINKALEWFNLSTNGKITVKEIDDRAAEMLKFYAENPPIMTDK